MGQVFYRLIYHAVWSTYLRHPLITLAVEEVLYPFLRNKIANLHGVAYAIGGAEDHMHAIVTIPPVVSISEMMGKLKGSSTHFLNTELQLTTAFAWQDGYGVTSVSPYHLQKMIKYVLRQKQHHRSGRLFKEFEQSESEAAPPEIGPPKGETVEGSVPLRRIAGRLP